MGTLAGPASSGLVLYLSRHITRLKSGHETQKETTGLCEQYLDNVSGFSLFPLYITSHEDGGLGLPGAIFPTMYREPV